MRRGNLAERTAPDGWIPTVTVFPRNDKEEWNIPLANRGCKIAVLCKNRRCGNCNAHKCALPRATLGFCTSTAQRICTISSSTDKNSSHNFVKLSAWWLAFARCFQPHTRRKPHTSNYPAVHSYTLYARTHTYIRTHAIRYIHEL